MFELEVSLLSLLISNFELIKALRMTPVIKICPMGQSTAD